MSLIPDALRYRRGRRVHGTARRGLTARQTKAKLLVQGKPNKLICRDGSSPKEPSRSTSAILKALRVHSRTEAIAALARRGINVDTLSARRTSVESTLR
jgi:DNA-binding NarL/FixJ family response regulator